MSEETDPSRPPSASDQSELSNSPDTGITIQQLVNGIYRIQITDPIAFANAQIEITPPRNDNETVVTDISSTRSESPLSDVFENDDDGLGLGQPIYVPMSPQDLAFQNQRRHIILWREYYDSRGRNLTNYTQALPDDPLGPFRIRRITSGNPDGTPDERWYEFPDGNENIGNTPRSQLTPEWHAWAGWLGPRAYFRVRHGYSFATRKYIVPDFPHVSKHNRRRARFIPTVVRKKKWFRCDHLPQDFPSNMPQYMRSCRLSAIQVMSSDAAFFDGDGNPIYLEPEEPFDDDPSVDGALPTPEEITQESVPEGPYDMFPRPMTPPTPRSPTPPPPLFRGPLAPFTMEQVNFLLAARLLLHYLSNGSIPLDDPIGQVLIHGFNIYMDGYEEPMMEDFDLD